jgi:hypothetical protein
VGVAFELGVDDERAHHLNIAVAAEPSCGCLLISEPELGRGCPAVADTYPRA